MPGPTPPLTHEQCRLKVCAVCYCKSGQKATKVVTETQETLIQKLVFSGYSRKDTKFPSGLCLTCLFGLLDHKKGQSLQNKKSEPRLLLLPDPDTYETELKRVTR